MDVLASTGDSETTKLVKEKLRNIQEPVKEILVKVDDRCTQLECSLNNAQAFRDKLDEFLRWMTTTEEILSNKDLISGNRDKCEEQLKECEVSCWFFIFIKFRIRIYFTFYIFCRIFMKMLKLINLYMRIF